MRRSAKDRVDRMARSWRKRHGMGWIEYLKRKTSEIGMPYAMELDNVIEVASHAYRAGFEEGLREAHRATHPTSPERA
jgi:hypothetical protein